jgi:hypothetical protein
MYTNIDELDLLNQPDEGDPLVWLRKHREELSVKYPTIEALFEYYKSVPSVEEVSARLKSEIAELERR